MSGVWQSLCSSPHLHIYPSITAALKTVRSSLHPGAPWRISTLPSLASPLGLCSISLGHDFFISFSVSSSPARGLRFLSNLLPSAIIFARPALPFPPPHPQIHPLLVSFLLPPPPTPNTILMNLPHGSCILITKSTCGYSVLIFLGCFITFITIHNKAQSCFLFAFPQKIDFFL